MPLSVYEFSSPSGGDQFISTNGKSKPSWTIRQFSSPSGGDQFISMEIANAERRRGKFSSPSGGDQFISTTSTLKI